MFGGISQVLRKAASVALVLGFCGGIGLIVHASFPEIAFAADAETGDFKYSGNVVAFLGTMFANLVNWISNGIGSLTLTVIETVVINVLNYNNFSSSNIVTLGWTLTRDLVNMFAVVVLLIMAVKAILGQGGGAWQQHIPRFFLGIVAANFSRTLGGLAIDASQIVMMTFVNALMSIAAGNFAQLMVMPQATTYSATTLQTATSESLGLISVASMVANAYAKLLVQVVVLGVLVLLAVAFIWRIVVLWIALIMAPIAGFSWGSKEIVGFLGRFYSEWMEAFVPPLVLGPMLTFFLYLALAASSNGNLAKTEAFPEPENRTTYGQITLEIFESANFTGLLLAVVFLILGIQQSAKIAAKMGGLASMAINEKMGKRVFSLGARVSGATVGRVAKAGVRTGSLGVRATGVGLELMGGAIAGKLAAKGGRIGAGAGTLIKGAGRVAGQAGRGVDEFVKMAPTDVTKMQDYTKRQAASAGDKARKGIIDPLAKGLADTPSVPRFSVGAQEKGFIAGTKRLANDAINSGGKTFRGAFVNPLLSASSTLAHTEHHLSEADVKAAKERVSHMSDQEKIQRLLDFQNGVGENSLEAVADAKHLKGLVFSDKGFEQLFTASVENPEEEIEKMLHDFQHDADAGHLALDKETWNKARSKYADLYTKVNAEKAAGFIDSDDFSGRLMRPQAGANTAVLSALERASTGKTENGRVVTKLDELNRGNYGSGKATEAARHISRSSFDPGPQQTSTQQAAAVKMIQSMIEGKVGVTNNLSAEEIKAEADAAKREGRTPTFTAETVQKQFVTQVLKTQSVENIIKAFDNGQYSEGHLHESLFDSGENANADKAMQAMAQSQRMDFSKMTEKTRDQINAQLVEMERAANRISNDDASQLRKKLIYAGKSIRDVLPGIDPNPATNPQMSLRRDVSLKAGQLFKADPSTISQIKDAVEKAKNEGERNNFTETVVKGLTKEDINKLAEMMRKETNVGKKANIKNAMKTIDSALLVHEVTEASSKESERLQDLRNSYNLADRYMI